MSTQIYALCCYLLRKRNFNYKNFGSWFIFIFWYNIMRETNVFNQFMMIEDCCLYDTLVYLTLNIL